MRIAFVNNHWQYGGAETVVRQLHRGCAAAGIRSRLYVDRAYVDDPLGLPRGERVSPLYPPVLDRLALRPDLAERIERWAPRAAWTDRRFRGLARKRFDLLHLHSFHGDYATVQSLGEVLRRAKVVWTLHGYWSVTGGCDNPNGCQRFLERCGECPQVGVWNVGPVDRTEAELDAKAALLAETPVQVVAPSRHLAATVRASRIGRHWTVHHIPSGVDPSTFQVADKNDPALRAALGLDPHALVLLVMNREFGDRQKGWETVAGALATLDGRGVQVVLVGRGAEAAARTLPDHLTWQAVEYVADRARVATYHAAADVVLFASRGENFPCATLEAMAAGCCLVTTPTEGVTEQVEDGRSAFVSTDRTAESLGVALRVALGDRERLRRYGAAARARVEAEFTEERMVSRYLALYRALAGSKVRAGARATAAVFPAGA